MINTILNALGQPIICAIFDENEKLIRFDIANINSNAQSENKGDSV